MRYAADEDPCVRCGGSGIEPVEVVPGANPNGFLVECADICSRCGGSGEEPK